MVSRRFRTIFVVSAALSAASPALADGFGGYGDPMPRHGHHWHHWHHGHRGGSWRKTYGGGYGVPVLIPGQGTYAGAISALRIRGHGTYYFSDCLCQGEEVQPVEPRPNAKIIDATKSDSCSYEHGVCVIRP